MSSDRAPPPPAPGSVLRDIAPRTPPQDSWPLRHLPLAPLLPTSRSLLNQLSYLKIEMTSKITEVGPSPETGKGGPRLGYHLFCSLKINNVSLPVENPLTFCCAAPAPSLGLPLLSGTLRQRWAARPPFSWQTCDPGFYECRWQMIQQQRPTRESRTFQEGTKRVHFCKTGQQKDPEQQ